MISLLLIVAAESQSCVDSLQELSPEFNRFLDCFQDEPDRCIELAEELARKARPTLSGCFSSKVQSKIMADFSDGCLEGIGTTADSFFRLLRESDNVIDLAANMLLLRKKINDTVRKSCGLFNSSEWAQASGKKSKKVNLFACSKSTLKFNSAYTKLRTSISDKAGYEDVIDQLVKLGTVYPAMLEDCGESGVGELMVKWLPQSCLFSMGETGKDYFRYKEGGQSREVQLARQQLDSDFADIEKECPYFQ